MDYHGLPSHWFSLTWILNNNKLKIHLALSGSSCWWGTGSGPYCTSWSVTCCPSSSPETGRAAPAWNRRPACSAAGPCSRSSWCSAGHSSRCLQRENQDTTASVFNDSRSKKAAFTNDRKPECMKWRENDITSASGYFLWQKNKKISHGH